ncbi:MAG: hypothetical protein PHZ19_10515 [Candidatus Thermoplasmatota archaeon]|nr:hypothetical protein [Candidatus Thermoplasmatota archaeon]
MNTAKDRAEGWAQTMWGLYEDHMDLLDFVQGLAARARSLSDVIADAITEDYVLPLDNDVLLVGDVDDKSEPDTVLLVYYDGKEWVPLDITDEYTDPRRVGLALLWFATMLYHETAGKCREVL